MKEIIVYSVIGASAVFFLYWYIKFRLILPLETELEELKGRHMSYSQFTLDMAANNYAPESVEQYKDIVNYYMVKLNKIFPQSTIFVFDREAEGWKLVNYLRGSRDEVNVMSVYRWDVFDRVAAAGDLIRVDLDEMRENNQAVDLFRSLECRRLAAFPFMKKDGKYRKVFFIGGDSEDCFSGKDFHLRFFFLFINGIFKYSEKNIALKKENENLANELDVLLKELDAAGTKLIQRAKERKTLGEVVTAAGSESGASAGCASILSAVSKMMEADVAACLVYDESINKLKVYPGAYGIKEKDYYTLDINDMRSSSVRVFVTGKPFLSNNAQEDENILSEYVRMWNINSLMVVPVRLHGKVIGVLRIGSFKKNFFNAEQLEFASIISDEIGIVIETFMLYENLSKTAKELAHLNSIKDEFLSTVSHELKTPLTTIKGFLDVILAGEAGELDEQQKKFLEIVSGAADRLHNLVSDLLDISRLSGKVEMIKGETDVASLIKNSVSNLYIKAKEKNISIETDIDWALRPVWADKKWISQVLDNLIMNAIKFSPEGSRVKVEARNKGDAILVGVLDNGTGIPKEERKMIFEKFFRGRNNRDMVQGTGLGLAISKSVIDKHGGRIWVESEEKKGSRFYFVLPVKSNGRSEVR